MQDITSSGVAASELRQIVERIERLEEDRKAIDDDKRDVYAEAKGRGFDVKALKAIIRLRAKSPVEREEEEAMLELYKSALGMDGYGPAPKPAKPADPPRNAPKDVANL